MTQPLGQSDAERLAALVRQGRTWRFVEEVTRYNRPSLLFDRPLEITVQMLRVIRMVDETTVIYGGIGPTFSAKDGPQ